MTGLISRSHQEHSNVDITGEALYQCLDTAVPAGEEEEKEETPTLKKSLHVTAMSVFSRPTTQESGATSTLPSSPVLVSGVTVIRGGRATPVLLLHSFRPSQTQSKSASASKPPPPPPTTITDESLLDWNLDLDIPPSILASSFPPSSLIPPLLPGTDSLLDISDPVKTDPDPPPALSHLEIAIPFTSFSVEYFAAQLLEVQHIVPFSGANRLAVSVSCRTTCASTNGVSSSSSELHGSLMVFTTTSDGSGRVSIDRNPLHVQRYDSEGDVVVGMCEMVGVVRNVTSEREGDALAVVNRRGEVVVYNQELVVVSRHSQPDDGRKWTPTSLTFCPPLEQLAVATTEGKVILFRMTTKEIELEESHVDGESKSSLHPRLAALILLCCVSLSQSSPNV